MFYNCYAFTRTGERVVIDLSVPHKEAIRRCEYEAAFIQGMGDELIRYDCVWVDTTMLPRVAMYDVQTDPFQADTKRVHWLSDIDEL